MVRAALALSVFALVATNAAGLAIQYQQKTTISSLSYRPSLKPEPTVFYVVEGAAGQDGKIVNTTSIAAIEIVQEILTTTVNKTTKQSFPKTKHPTSTSSKPDLISTLRRATIFHSISTVFVTTHLTTPIPAVRPTGSPNSASHGVVTANSTSGTLSYSTSISHTTSPNISYIEHSTTTDSSSPIVMSGSESPNKSPTSAPRSSSSPHPVSASTHATTTTTGAPRSRTTSSVSSSITAAPSTSSDAGAPKIVPVTAIPTNEKPPTSGWKKWCSDGDGFKEVCSLYAPGVTPSM